MMDPTMEGYMTKTRTDYGSGVACPKIDEQVNFEIKGQFLKELRDNTFSGSEHKDPNEHIKNVLEIADLFHILKFNNLGREIKKVNEKVYATQVGCEICKGPYYTKDCLDKEDGKTLEESYYTQFGVRFPQGQFKAAALGYYQRNNGNPLYQERRQSLEYFMSKFMTESARIHEENSNLIKEIRTATDSAIIN
ncbi:hypothetical protein Tco_0938191 [Tanacetum coccineum]|uniref:Uncharacterized protein n=1 Tax=Tanacetum coccineum TaxID=301880 RepID=A0ABQ5DJ55_9ASTR